MKRSTRSLRVEPLERRELLAGVHAGTGLPYHTVIDLGKDGSWDDPPVDNNVTVQVVDGRLVIRGDAAGNQITVVHRHDGSGWIQGINRKTTLNGRLYGGTIDWQNPQLDDWVLQYSGVTAGIDIDLGGGDDYLHLVGWELPDVAIATGSGDDRVNFGSTEDPLHPPWWAFTASIKFPVATRIEGDLYVDLGEGDDWIRAFAEVAGDAEVRLGGGDDTLDETPQVVVGYATSTVLRVAGNQVIDFGAGEEAAPDPLTASGASRLPPPSLPQDVNIDVPPTESPESPEPAPPLDPPQPPPDSLPPELPPPELPPPSDAPPTGVVIVDDPNNFFTKVSPELVDAMYRYSLHEQNPDGPFVPPAGVEAQDGRLRVEVTTAGTMNGLRAALARIGLDFQPVAAQRAVGWLAYGRLYALQLVEEIESATPAPAEFVGPLEFREES